MERLTDEQIAKICFDSNPLKGYDKLVQNLNPRCPYPRRKINRKFNDF